MPEPTVTLYVRLPVHIAEEMERIIADTGESRTSLIARLIEEEGARIAAAR